MSFPSCENFVPFCLFWYHYFFVRYLQRQLYSKKQHFDPKVFVTKLNLRYVYGLSRTPWLLYCGNSRLILFCWGIYFISHTNVLQVNPRTLAIKALFSQWIIFMFTGLGTPSTGLRPAELCHYAKTSSYLKYDPRCRKRNVLLSTTRRGREFCSLGYRNLTFESILLKKHER